AGDDDHKLKFWDTAKGTEIRTMEVNKKVPAITFSADGKKILAWASESAVQIFDTATGKQLKTLTAGDKEVSCLSFTPDGTLLAMGMGEENSTIAVWDVEKAQRVGNEIPAGGKL